MAWSKNALNLISALHSTSGLGVRPASYSRKNSANTRSLYSAAKFTCSISMPSTSATAAASKKSCRDEQCSESSSSSQFFMKMPSTSWPCCLSKYALTAESTPPLKPTIIRCFCIDCNYRGYRPESGIAAHFSAILQSCQLKSTSSRKAANQAAKCMIFLKKKAIYQALPDCERNTTSSDKFIYKRYR